MATVGLALILGGLSIGFYNSGKTISLGGIFQKLFTISAVIALLIALAPTNTNVIQNDGSIEAVEIIPQDVRMLILGPSLVLTLVFFFLRNVKKIMHDNSCLMIQTSQADMCKNYEFDTIYHEHLSFFNIKSINFIFCWDIIF